MLGSFVLNSDLDRHAVSPDTGQLRTTEQIFNEYENLYVGIDGFYISDLPARYFYDTGDHPTDGRLDSSNHRLSSPSFECNQSSYAPTQWMLNQDLNESHLSTGSPGPIISSKDTLTY